MRIQFPGAIYHVTVRGNGRERIFVDRADRERFLKRLSDSVDVYSVRVYLFCLMTNHFHLLVETPDANISRFMQSVLTGYTVYYNLRHRHSGHVMQGRYGAKLVKGDEYLMALSRYIHLNPVHVGAVKDLSVKERRAWLRKYPWSSYASYIGGRKKLDFVEYEPVLAQVSGGRRQRQRLYRQYVEAGLAETDEDMMEALKESSLCIGTEVFRDWVQELYVKLQVGHEREDIAFRKTGKRLKVKDVVEAVCEQFGTKTEELVRRKRGDYTRAVAAKLLCKYAGLTQRDVARELNVRTGSAISHEIKKLQAIMETDKRLLRRFRRLQRVLDYKKEGVANYYFKV